MSDKHINNPILQPIVQPMIDEIKEQQKPKVPTVQPPQEGPLAPAELDQDPGGGYNPNHTYPQS